VKRLKAHEPCGVCGRKDDKHVVYWRELPSGKPSALCDKCFDNRFTLAEAERRAAVAS
jgi:hypothetical protein